MPVAAIPGAIWGGLSAAGGGLAALGGGGVMGGINAGTQLAGSGMGLFGAAKNAFGGGTDAKPLFPGMMDQYLTQLTTGKTKAGPQGFGPQSMSTMQEMAKTGMPTDVGPMWEALLASRERFDEQGRANILEQFSGTGNRYSSPLMDKLVDYESQLNAEYGSIFAQYIFQAMEAARARQMQASAMGMEAYGAPALTMQGQNVGSNYAQFGKEVGSIGTQLYDLFKRKDSGLTPSGGTSYPE